MADFSVAKRNYFGLWKKLLPSGWLWAQSDSAVMQKMLDALAAEPARVDQRALDLLKELDPSRTFELLDRWEKLLGIPDECTPAETPTLQIRRYRVLQKLVTGGGQSKDFFKLIAKQLGYDVNVFDVKNYNTFRVGKSRVGQQLTNGEQWAFSFRVSAPASFVRKFKVGQSTVGERLSFTENQTLECVTRKFAPAHTHPNFAYIE